MGTLRKSGFRGLVVAQTLGVFNDNAYKYLVIFVLFKHPQRNLIIALTGALLIVPFVLFSSTAGWLADRFSKRSVLLWAKGLEIGAMSLAFGALATYRAWPGTGSLIFLLSVVFIMGVQSAVFSPAKYGSVPELVDRPDVARANGVLEMTVFAGIILGCAAGPALFQWVKPLLWPAALPLIAVAVAGTVAVGFVRRVPPSGAPRPLRAAFGGELRENLRRIIRGRDVFLAALGYAWFMMVGALFNFTVILYGKELMHLRDDRVGVLLAITGVGIAVGAPLAGRLSRRRVELGILPVGAMGLAVLPILLAFSYRSFAGTAALLFAVGAAAGLFIVPLAAYIQINSRPDERGRIVATWNFMNYVGVILGSAVFYLCTEIIRLNPAQVFLVSGVAAVPVTIYILAVLPMFTVRFVLTLVMRLVYRIEVVGRRNVPHEGGALLVSNHISYIDALVIGCCIPRNVRFMMSREYAEKPLLGAFARLFDTIIISEDDSPRQVLMSLREAQHGLENGDLVCIFAEGVLSRTGNLNPFKHGMEILTRRLTVPIIPLHLDRMWGSVFSFERGKFFFKVPHSLPYPITVSFGEPMPHDSSAFAVRQAIIELGADAFKCRKASQRPLHAAFIRNAKRRLISECMADSTGRSLSWARALAASLLLSRQLRHHCRDQRMVGIMLPAGVAAALSNIATLMSGKTPVNLNFTTSRDALDSAMQQCEIETIITSRLFLRRIKVEPSDRMVMLEDLFARPSHFARLVYGVAAIALPAFAIEHVLCRRARMDDVATVLFTSGSTGIPKGVVLSHHNIVSNAESISQIIQFRRDDVMMGVLPFFHAFGLTATLWLPLLMGMKAVFHTNPLEPQIVGQTVAGHRATILLATPSFFLTYCRRCEPTDFASLRLPVVGGEKLQPAIAREFEEKFGRPLFEGYGCTETGPVVSVNVPDVTHRGVRQVCHKPGSVGQPLPGVAVRIIDPDRGCEVGADQEGLVRIKGPNVMGRSLSHPEQSRAVFHGEWYITGDLGKIDEDGFLYITDRLSRFSKIGGEMVPHIRIERAIAAALGRDDTPGIIISLPDERKGERLVVLHTVPRLDVPALISKLAGMGLPRLWIPARNCFHYVESLPLLGSGKLDMRASTTIASERERAAADA